MRSHGLLLSAGLLVLYTTRPIFAAEESGTPPMTASVELTNSSGEKIGKATLTEMKDGVLISIQASKLSPGQHGIHFHETGICTLPDFKTAGEHFKPGQKEHGLKNPKGRHEGDLPNLDVKADGTVATEMVSKTVTLKKGKNSLLKRGGTSLVIHEKSDDQRTNPSGSSGDRIACGVIESKKAT